MNVRRGAAGMPALLEETRLSQAAADRMQDMEEQGYWNHVDPHGRSPFQWLRPRGYDFSYAGENLAAGFETAEIMVDGWMESKGHRDNIMSPIYSQCGVAVIDGATTGRGTGRSVVVLFARPRVNALPSPDPRPVSTPASRR
ncbi:MAG TPA: CAP domain-containing protein [Thermoanaerobaculia bacterium]|nr:CAP domain-containing protein [Thermoanaerobaculia bacterium]